VFERLGEEEMRVRAAAFLESSRARRTVRDFSPEPIPLDVVEAASATAGTAPSGAHRQPWTSVHVTDPALKRRIRVAAEEEERQSYERRMPDDASKPQLEDAPALIVVFEQAFGLGPDGTKVKHYYVRESVGIAVGILLAALHRAGLVALTHTPSPMGFLAEVLERPPYERAFVLIPVGYPADGATVPDLARKQLDEILVRR